jgi:hypothetical protein
MCFLRAEVKWFKFKKDDKGKGALIPIELLCLLCGSALESFVGEITFVTSQDDLLKKFKTDKEFKKRFNIVRAYIEQNNISPMPLPLGMTWRPQSVGEKKYYAFTVRETVAFVATDVLCAFLEIDSKAKEFAQKLKGNQKMVTITDIEGRDIDGFISTLQSAQTAGIPHMEVEMSCATETAMRTPILDIAATVHSKHARQVWNAKAETSRRGLPPSIRADSFAKIEPFDSYRLAGIQFEADLAEAQERLAVAPSAHGEEDDDDEPAMVVTSSSIFQAEDDDARVGKAGKRIPAKGNKAKVKAQARARRAIGHGRGRGRVRRGADSDLALGSKPSRTTASSHHSAANGDAASQASGATESGKNSSRICVNPVAANEDDFDIDISEVFLSSLKPGRQLQGVGAPASRIVRSFLCFRVGIMYHVCYEW